MRRVRFLVASASGIVNQVGEKKEPTSQPRRAIPAVVAGRMTVVRHGQLGAAVGQVRNADFLGPFCNDVVNDSAMAWAADTRRPDCWARF